MNDTVKAQNATLAAQRKRLCQYVRNTARVPLAVHDFDDDHTPVGEFYRDDLLEAGLIKYSEETEGSPGGVLLTADGKVLADG